jgi:hypothetical protein
MRSSWTILALGLVFAPAATSRAGSSARFRVERKRTAPSQKTVIAQLRRAMTDRIEASGAFTGRERGTPVMSVIPSEGSLVKVADAAVELDPHAIDGPGARYIFKGPRASTEFTLLMPVVAHAGLPYKEYAATAIYEVRVDDLAGRHIQRVFVRSAGFGKDESSIGPDDLVTEAKIHLPFDKADGFRISFSPMTNKGVYTSGREVVVSRE